MNVFFVLLLLFVEVILFGIAWYLFKGDLVSPSIFTLAFFILSTLSFMSNMSEWLVVCTFKGVMLFALSFIFMISVEYLFSHYKIIYGKAKGLYASCTEANYNQHLYISKPFNIILFLLFASFSLYYIYQVYQSGMHLGATGLLDSIGINKEKGQYDLFARLSYNIVRMASYVYIVIFTNNVFKNKEKISKNLLSLLVIFFTILITFVSGQRSACICYIIAIFVSTMISLYGFKKLGKTFNVNKYIKKIVSIAISIIVLFALSANIVKGTNIQRDFCYYITYYFGSTVALMLRIVENPTLCHEPFIGYFGEKTFLGFWRDMHSYGLVSKAPADRRWINMGSALHPYSAGNEYTFFCGPYIDFGFLGTLIFIIIFYSVFSYLYYAKILRGKNSICKFIICAIYIWLYTLVAMSFYQDTIRVYSRVINVFYFIYILSFGKMFLKLKQIKS